MIARPIITVDTRYEYALDPPVDVLGLYGNVRYRATAIVVTITDLDDGSQSTNVEAVGRRLTHRGVLDTRSVSRAHTISEGQAADEVADALVRHRSEKAYRPRCPR